jgi:IPT/TIG domain
MIAIRRILIAAVTLSLFAVPVLTDAQGVPARGAAPVGSIRLPQRSVTLTGSITEAIGRPVSGALVRIVGLATASRAAVMTSSSGSFSAQVTAPPANHGDNRYVVTASAWGYFSRSQTVREWPSNVSSIRLDLSPDHGRLYGQVQSPMGKPDSGAGIRLVSEATGASTRAKSSRNGSFTISAPALPYTSSTDQYKILANSAGRSWIATRSIRPGTSVHIVTRLRGDASGLTDLGAGSTQRPSQIIPGPDSGLTPTSQFVQPTPKPSCPKSGETTWTGSGGGNAWETAGNWTNGAPTASTYACITGGAAAVTVNSTAKAAGLLLVTGASVNVQTGALNLQGSSTPSAVEGSLTVRSGAAVNVLPGSLLLNAAGGTITNKGSFAVTGSFEQDAGHVAAGAKDAPVDLMSGSSLTLAGSGPGAFRVFDSTNPSAQNIAVSLAGNLASGQSLDIQSGEFGSFGTGTTTINAATGFTNAGAITEDATTSGNGNIAFALPSGATLTNTGTFTVAGASNQFQNTETFTGRLANQGGTLNAGAAGKSPANLIFAPGDTVVNEGAVNILSKSALTLDPASKTVGAATFKNETGGTVTNANSLSTSATPDGFVVQGSFVQDAGHVAGGAGDGPINLLGGSSLSFGGTGAGAFAVFDATNTSTQNISVSLAGDLASGQSLEIGAGEFGPFGVGTTTIRGSGSFTSGGAITEDATTTGNGSIAFDLPSGATFTNTGDFTVRGAGNQFPSNSEAFKGNFTNQGGTLNAGAPNKNPANLIFAAGDTVVNQGAVNVLAGSALTLSAPSNTKAAGVFRNEAGGIVANANSVSTSATPDGFVVQGSFVQDAGIVAGGAGDGPINLLGGSSVSFGGTGAGAFAVFDATNSATQNISVSLAGDLASGQSLEIGAGEFGPFGVGTTTIRGSGSFTNGGAITEDTTTTGNGSIAFDLPSGATLTNTGSFTVRGAGNQFSNSETFKGNFTNQGGTLTAGVGGVNDNPANLIFASPDTFLNQGAVNILQYSVVTFAAGTSFTNGAGGSITNANALGSPPNPLGLLDSGSFKQDAGTISTGAGDGPVDLQGGSSLTFGGTGAGAFAASDPNAAGGNFTVSLAGGLASRQSLDVKAGGFGQFGSGATTIDAAGSFTNAGAITVEAGSSNSNSGEFVFNFPTGSSITNIGRISVGSGADLSGTTQTFAASVTNLGSLIATNQARVVITGNLTDLPGSTTGANVLNQPNQTMITVNGKTQLAGTLNFQTDPNAKLSAGQTFDLLSSPTISGAFAFVTGLYAGGTLVYNVSQKTGDISAAVASETNSPELFAINPSAGPAGSTVTLFGSALLGTSAVSFGSKQATAFTVVSATQLTAVVPAGSGNALPVTVTTPNGTSPSFSAPRFTYAVKGSGTAGTARLHLALRDSVGDPLAGATIGVEDATTGNPVGLILTGTDGAGTLGGLSNGETVQVTVAAASAPYGPAQAVYSLSAGSNDKVLTLPIQPLLSSDASATAPDGTALAIWPETVPQPKTAVPGGGSLSSPLTLADIEFTMTYASGDKFILSSDAAGAKPFCVDGNWTLTVSGPAPATTQETTSGSGCPASGGPIDIGKTLNLLPGRYGGEFTAVAPAGATTAGSTDIYLLPPAGTIGDLRVTPGALASHAQLGGTDVSTVGQSSVLNVTLGGFPQPGAIGYHFLFSFDPAGISLPCMIVPAHWGGKLCGLGSNGLGGLLMTNHGNPIPVGGTVLAYDVTCKQPGIWTVTFSGDYWLPSVSAGYADAVEGSAAVICNAPSPPPKTTPTGVSLDPTNGDVEVTVTGSNLAGAAKAELLDTSGTVAATSTQISAAGTVATTQFPATPPGLYNLMIMDGGGTVIARTSGTPFEVSPALPQFGLSEVDNIPNVPGIATTHTFQVVNTGTVDGIAVIVFTFPAYMAPEPVLDLSAAPPGTRLLLRGKTRDGWVEYAAIPLAAAQAADLEWTAREDPQAVFGPTPSTAIGMPIIMTQAVAGQFTRAEWAAESGASSASIVDASFRTGLGDFTGAVKTILTLPAADVAPYLRNLPDGNQATGIAGFISAVQDVIALDLAQSSKHLAFDAHPVSSAQVVCSRTILHACFSSTPPPPSNTAQPPDSLGDPMASFFAGFTRNVDMGLSAGYVTDSAGSGPAKVVYSFGNGADLLDVGTGEEFRSGFVVDEPAAQPLSTNGASSVGSVTAAGSPSAEAVAAGSWLANLNSFKSKVPPGVRVSGLPFQENGTVTLDFGAGFQDGSAGVGQVVIDDVQAEQPPAAGAMDRIQTVLRGSGARPAAGVPPPLGSGYIPIPPGPCDTIKSRVGEDLVDSSTGLAKGKGVETVLENAGQVSAAEIVGTLLAPFHVIEAVKFAAALAAAALYALICPDNTSSEDPNNITAAPAGAGKAGWIASQPVAYRVDFFNQPKATAPAFNIVVKLHLDANLDPSTVQPGASSFPGTQFTFDPTTSTVTWILPNIDLPPDTKPPNGEAWVSFSASPKPGLKTGTAIHESAQVLFDFNPPITTPTRRQTIDATPPKVVKLKAGKLKGHVLPLTWKVKSKAGAASSELYVSTNGKGLIPFAETVKKSFKFAVQAGKKYGFAVQATDVAGLTSPLPKRPVVTVHMK